MYEKEIINLLNESTVFMATTDGIFPKGHFMKVFVDLSGFVWLYHLSQVRIHEISLNNRGVLMLSDDKNRLIAEGEFFEPLKEDLKHIPIWNSICGKYNYNEIFPSPIYKFKVFTIYYTAEDGKEITLTAKSNCMHFYEKYERKTL